MTMVTSPPAPAETEQADPANPAATSPRKPNVHNGFGPLLRRLHFYAGVFVAPFLLVVALTGFLFAFTPQLDQIAYHDQLHVTPRGPQVPLSEQVAAAQAVVPDGVVVAVHTGAAADATTKVEFSLPALGENQRTVYIDPYTAEVRGVLTTWFGSTPLTTWLDQMHANLNLGETGSLYSELAASWLWVLVLGGLILWWRHQRGTRTARRLLAPGAGRQGVRRSRSWHAATGVWIAVVLLFLSATGLTWSHYAGATFDTLRAALNSDSVALNTSLDGMPSGAGGGHHGAGGANASGASQGDLDAISAAARTAALEGPITITPGKTGQAWTVAQTDNTWPVRYDKIAVHPVTGEIVDTVRWAEQPLLSKLTTYGIMAHMGVLFGLPNQIFLALVAAGLITLIVIGYRMWWQRRPTRHSGPALGAPPARGAWRHADPAVLLPAAAVAIVIAWALPLLGWTLLGFLVIDAIAGLWKRRKAFGPPAAG